MFRRASATGVAVFVVVVGLAAQASLTLDQEAPTTAPPAPFAIAVGGPVDQIVSQTVTAGVSGRLRAVEVPIGCESGSVILEIRDVDGLGQPGPTVFFSDTFPAADFPIVVGDTYERFRLRGRPVRLTAGDTFTISLSNPTGSCGIWPGPEGDPYAAGTGWADPSAGPIVPLSAGTGRDDMPFRTFMQ